MTTANYMQVLDEGHCLTCHKNYKPSEGMHPCFLKPNATPCGEACGRWFDGNKYKTFTKTEIDALLSQQKEKLVEEVEKMKRGIVEGEDERWAVHYKGYDDAISDVIKLLKT